MSQAEVIKALKLKTNSVKRLHKELCYYVKEKEKEQAKVDKLKADNADVHDLKQAENVLNESSMMIPETRQRLEVAFGELQAFLSENSQDAEGSEELTTAQEVIATVEALFKH